MKPQNKTNKLLERCEHKCDVTGIDGSNAQALVYVIHLLCHANIFYFKIKYFSEIF